MLPEQHVQQLEFILFRTSPEVYTDAGLRRPGARASQHDPSAAQSMELQRLGIENIPGQESARVVHLNPPEGAVDRSYSSNSVHTAK